MTQEEIDIIRLALDTPEHDDKYIKYCLMAYEVLDEYEFLLQK